MTPRITRRRLRDLRQDRFLLPLAASLLGIALLAVALNSFTDHRRAITTATRQVGSRPVSLDQISGANSPESLPTTIAKARARLHTHPDDRQTWATLGLAYLQQVRFTGDTANYPKAEGALQRSLALDPARNTTAMIGLGALANARNDFAQALNWVRKASAVNPSDPSLYAVTDDALTQLGDAPGAGSAAAAMLKMQPGVPALTRTAAHKQDSGDPSGARKTLMKALSEATLPSDITACRYLLGELAFNEGDPLAAFTQYQLGLTTDPGSGPLLAGRAKAEAALGRSGDALNDYALLVKHFRQPQYRLEYAELLQSLGRDTAAVEQLALLTAEQKQRTANGVIDNLLIAVVEADHGAATTAVRLAEAEWNRRQSPVVADALGWALHRAGRDTEALGYATRAGDLGLRTATYHYHRGMIELALNHRTAARDELRTALRINPYFSVLQAPVARRALAATVDN